MAISAASAFRSPSSSNAGWGTWSSCVSRMIVSSFLRNVGRVKAGGEAFRAAGPAERDELLLEIAEANEFDRKEWQW